jgi:threonine/homoserine/homoserine lactone efflux protein
MPDALIPSAAMLQLLALYAIVVLTPGPIALFTGNLAALHGFARTVPFVFGLGAGAAALAMLLGLAAGLLSSLLPNGMLQLAGAAVLLWLAVVVLRMGESSPAAIEAEVSGAGLLAAGMLTALTSPLTGFFLAALFAGWGTSPPGSETVILIAAAVGGTNLAWYAALALFLSRPAARLAILRWREGSRVLVSGLLAACSLYMAGGAIAGGVVGGN